MNSLENLTLVGVYLQEGDIKSRDFNYYITQREGNFLYDLKLGDPVSDSFGSRCELMVENSYTRNQIIYNFSKIDGQWYVLSWTPSHLNIKDLPNDSSVLEALGEAFDAIFVRYYREIESRRIPPKVVLEKPQKEADPQPPVAKAKPVASEENTSLFDLLDEDLLRPIVMKAGEDGVRETDIEKLEIKAAATQIQRLRECDNFLKEQMKERDGIIKDMKDTLEVNQKAFSGETGSASKKTESTPSEEDQIKYKTELFVGKVWDELTLRLGFPDSEKEKSIREYFTGLVETWLPISFSGLNLNEPSAKPAAEPKVPDEQELQVTRQNFFNDLQDFEIYTGETRMIKDLCADDLELTEMVIEYIRRYGKDTIKQWWAEYQKYSKDIDF